MNKCFLCGEVASDIHQGETQNGATRLFFTVMTTREYKEQVFKSYIPCNAFGNVADQHVNELAKGVTVFIEGEISPFKDKEGNYKMNVKISEMHVGNAPTLVQEGPSTNKVEAAKNYYKQAKSGDKKTATIEDDEIPF